VTVVQKREAFEPLFDEQTKHPRVEIHRTLQIADLEMNMAKLEGR
jgi:hypothetical protein